jgi:hypothetical protein
VNSNAKLMLDRPHRTRIANGPRLIACLSLFAASLVFAANAESSAPPISGMVELIAPPPSVALNALESNSVVRFFAEQTNLLLNQSVSVDITQPGIVDHLVNLTPGQIAANQLVNSYFFDADTLPGSGILTFQGSVMFDEPVLGILIRGESLNATDAILGSPSTAYFPNNQYRGFDGPDFSSSSEAVRDLVQLWPDGRTVSFQLHSEAYTDQFRVITASVPEPASVGGIGVLFAVASISRGRRVYRSPRRSAC